MKRILINSLYSLVTGLCFMAGVLLVSQLFDKINNNKETVFIEQPAGFKFKNHQIVPDQPTFTIEGELFNTQDIKWKDVQIVVSIFAGEAYMTYCKTTLNQIGKNSHQRFTLVCRETEGSNLPDNLSYKLIVKRAIK